jgi:hypothetical protein
LITAASGAREPQFMHNRNRDSGWLVYYFDFFLAMVKPPWLAA